MSKEFEVVFPLIVDDIFTQIAAFFLQFVYFCSNKHKLTTIILPSEVTMATVPEPDTVKETTFSGQKYSNNVNKLHINDQLCYRKIQLPFNYISALQQRTYTAAC